MTLHANKLRDAGEIITFFLYEAMSKEEGGLSRFNGDSSPSVSTRQGTEFGAELGAPATPWPAAMRISHDRPDLGVEVLLEAARVASTVRPPSASASSSFHQRQRQSTSRIYIILLIFIVTLLIQMTAWPNG